jgi:hypothetical protein
MSGIKKLADNIRGNLDIRKKIFYKKLYIMAVKTVAGTGPDTSTVFKIKKEIY